jgi:coproporphyrinogen III oxidase-like Fe-S oxidoreductase
LEQQYAHAITRNQQAGLLQVDEHGIRLTPQGWLLGNRVSADFMPEQVKRQEEK